MSPQFNQTLTLDTLMATPFVIPMMALSIAVALCLDFADLVIARDALQAFPIQKR
jgi:hypothetical protein